MELYYPVQYSSLPEFFGFSSLFRSNTDNHARWTQTPDSYIYTTQLPGVQKEDVRVEVENSQYLVIRIESGNSNLRSSVKKLRLPELANTNGIRAGFEDGVLTVSALRTFSRRNIRPSLEDAATEHDSVAPAA